MAATIKDISAMTQLSISTISKYLNGGVLRPANKEKIEQAIIDLDYRVNEFARSLKTNKSMTIGILIPSLNNMFCTQIVSIAEHKFRLHGYSVIVCDTGDDDIERQVIEFMVNKKVDGIITMPNSLIGDQFILPISMNIPIVMFDHRPREMICDVVMIDNAFATKRATEYLINKGHTKIGIIIGPQITLTAQERMLGYRTAYYENNLIVDENHILYGDYSIDGAYEIVKKALSSKLDITALITTNYDMTIGTVIAINELGINIPDELSLIGFDNYQLAQVVKPKISIITQPMDEIGNTVADIMLKRLTGKGPDELQIVKFKTGFIEGDSVMDLH